MLAAVVPLVVHALGIPAAEGVQRSQNARPTAAEIDRALRREELAQALLAAVRTANAPRVRALLAKGARVDGGEWGPPPLFALDGPDAGRMAIARLLIAKGARVNEKDPEGTPLIVHAVGMRWSPAMTRFLVAKGADVNAGDAEGRTALHQAVSCNDPASVDLLLRLGASVKARTRERPAPPSSPDGRSPGSPPEAREAIEASREKWRRQAERAYARAFEPGYRPVGETPLFALALTANMRIYDRLVKAGADPKATDANGWTLLHHAVKIGDAAFVRALLDRGADPNAATRRGNRPLHLATRTGYGFPNAPVVQALRSRGADPSLTNAAGETPLDVLRREAGERLVRIRLEPDDATGEAIVFYRDVATTTARALDPDAAEFPLPPPIVDARGRRYRALSFDADLDAEDAPLDGSAGEGFAAERAVRVEGGRAILELRFVNAEESLTFTIREIELHNYEPLDPLPISVTVPKGAPATVAIAFPLAAAEGGAVRMRYGLKATEGEIQGEGNRSGGGEMSEGPGPDPRFTSDPSTGRVSVSHGLRGRTVVLRIVSARSDGKAVPALAGQEFTIRSGEETTIPGLRAGQPFGLKYRIRALPNRRWRDGSI